MLLRKRLLDLPKIGENEIGSICFEPWLMFETIAVNKSWIDLRDWIDFIPERFKEEAVATAYMISKGKTFAHLRPNVRAIESFIYSFHKIVEQEYTSQVLSIYGWKVSEVQPIGLKKWDGKIHCHPYSLNRKAGKIAFRRRVSLEGLKTTYSQGTIWNKAWKNRRAGKNSNNG